MAPVLRELVIGDPPEAWAALGFTVAADGSCRIGTVQLRLVGRAQGKGIRGWGLSGLPDMTGLAATAAPMAAPMPAPDIDGIATTALPEPSGPADHPPTRHANGVLRIDHLVLMTPDIGRTVAALQGVGMAVRRVRDAGEMYPVPMTQTFFRLGEVLLEVIAPVERADGPSRFYGLALDVDDIDGLPDRFGADLTPPKVAVQPGRRIATLRHKAVGLSTAIAFMTPVT